MFCHPFNQKHILTGENDNNSISNMSQNGRKKKTRWRLETFNLTHANQSSRILNHFLVSLFVQFSLIHIFHFSGSFFFSVFLSLRYSLASIQFGIHDDYIQMNWTERANSHKRNGIVCMANAPVTKSIILFWAIVDFLVNTKEKALPMLVFIHTESEYSFEFTKTWIHFQKRYSASKNFISHLREVKENVVIKSGLWTMWMVHSWKYFFF